MGGGPKVAYPKHVWSPAGGWYCQPANWRANTAVATVFIASAVFAAWTFSAERETRPRNYEPGAFAPSRLWSRQVVQWDREARAAKEGPPK